MELVKVANLADNSEIYIDRETGDCYLCQPGKRKIIKKGEPRPHQLIAVGSLATTLNL